jgi:hypothetical protein
VSLCVFIASFKLRSRRYRSPNAPHSTRGMDQSDGDCFDSGAVAPTIGVRAALMPCDESPPAAMPPTPPAGGHRSNGSLFKLATRRAAAAAEQNVRCCYPRRVAHRYINGSISQMRNLYFPGRLLNNCNMREICDGPTTCRQRLVFSRYSFGAGLKSGTSDGATFDLSPVCFI